MNILAIESSFDETACAVVKDGTKIISNVLASSHEMHDKYGGVVPEIAARRQLECIIPVIAEALSVFRPSNHQTIQPCIQEHIDAIAVTVGPGLIGSLLVGVETAKTLAFVCNKPIIPVNHVLAHMYANFVQNGHMDTWSDGQKQTIQPSNHPTIQYPPSPCRQWRAYGTFLMKSAKELRWLGGRLMTQQENALIKLLVCWDSVTVEVRSKLPLRNIQYPISNIQ